MIQEEQRGVSGLVPAMEVYQKIRPLALGGRKTPFGLSNPVLRRRGENLCLAFFVYTYTYADLQNKAVRRPSLWLTADLTTGQLLERIPCSNEDFSDAPFTEYFSTENPGALTLAKTHHQEAYAILDGVRAAAAQGGTVPETEYAAYLHRMLRAVPPAYHRFYWELSRP